MPCRIRLLIWTKIIWPILSDWLLKYRFLKYNIVRSMFCVLLPFTTFCIYKRTLFSFDFWQWFFGGYSQVWIRYNSIWQKNQNYCFFILLLGNGRMVSPFDVDNRNIFCPITNIWESWTCNWKRHMEAVTKFSIDCSEPWNIRKKSNIYVPEN